MEMVYSRYLEMRRWCKCSPGSTLLQGPAPSPEILLLALQTLASSFSREDVGAGPWGGLRRCHSLRQWGGRGLGLVLLLIHPVVKSEPHV